MSRGLRWLVAGGTVLASLGGLGSVTAASASASVSCSLFASPGGSDGGDGSVLQPFRSAQKLVDSLSAGQTGCLRGGSYSQSELDFHHGGRSGAPVTLASYPGETATLTGGFVYVVSGSDFVTLENLRIDASAATQVGVQLMAANSSLIGDDITNGSAHYSCVILGSNVGWGHAVGTVIENDVIHECGNTGDGNQDHAIYFDNSTGGMVSHNVIWGTSAYAIHLYQNAQDNQITHNVIVDNGYGVIFAGSGSHTSNGNVVADNVIADSSDGYDVQSYWGGPVGNGNLLAHNCLSSGHLGEVTTVPTGFASADNVNAEPRFVNAAAHDYRLQPDSPCARMVDGTTSRVTSDPVATIARHTGDARGVTRAAHRPAVHRRHRLHRRQTGPRIAGHRRHRLHRRQTGPRIAGHQRRTAHRPVRQRHSRQLR